MEKMTNPINSILFILNPISGGHSKSLKIKKEIQQLLSKSSFKINFEETAHHNHAYEISSQYVPKPHQLYVVIGGDGTVQQVARGIAGTNKVMAVIPTGSGNGFSNHIQAPKTPKIFVEKLLNEEYTIQTIPTGTVQNNLFLNVAGIGLDAEIACLFNKTKKRGLINYAILTLKCLKNYQAKTYELAFDNQKIQGKFMSVCIAKGSEYGNHFKINPDAKLENDYLDVILIKKQPLFKLIKVVLRMLRGKKIYPKYAHHYKIKEMDIVSKTALFHTDGECMQAEKECKKIRVRINPTLSVKILKIL